MTNSERAAWTGAGLLILGIGASVIGAAMITPACVSWSARRVRKIAGKTADRLFDNVEDAAVTMGNVAGRMQRTVRRAAKAASASSVGAAHTMGDTLIEAGKALRRA